MRRSASVLIGLLGLVASADVAAVRPALAQSGSQASPPAPPRVFLDTSYQAPTGRTVAVRAGSDLQAALNAAQPGEVISLEPGAVFRGNFVLPKKAGDRWLVVRSGAPDEKLPPPGSRVTPASAAVMPKILSPNQGPALSAAPGAHHYRLIGIELATTLEVKETYSIVAFGGDQPSEAETPHNLIVDRCFVHGHAQLSSRRGVLLNSAASAVIDSHISEIHAVGADSQAILGYNGRGPFKIVNNYLEAAAENIMFGGSDPAIRDLVPSDIEIRGNHLFKPMRWRPGDPTFAGVAWTVKNLLELKNAQRVLIEDNLLENNWATALVLTPRNQGRNAPWSVVQDVLFRNNVVRNVVSGFVVQGSDDGAPSESAKRIAITNNLWFFSRTFFGITAGLGAPLEDLVVDHNTAIPGGYSAYFVDVRTVPALVRFRLTNNVMAFGGYGATFLKPNETWTAALPGVSIARNALVNMADTADGQGAVRNRPPDYAQALYTSFPSAAAAGLNPDGTLTDKSPNRRAGTDGKDVGVDFEQLRRAMASATAGK